MVEQNKSGGQENNGQEKIARHLVSLPTILLQRIDESTIQLMKTKNSTVKKLSKSTSVFKTKSTSTKKPVVKNVTPKAIQPRGRGRPRKEISDKTKLQKPLKNAVKSASVLKSNKTVNKPKLVSKPQNSAVKNILKKTMLQKKSKVVIPQAKKPKLIKKPPIKKTPQKTPIKKTPQKNTSKSIVAKPKNGVSVTSPLATDSSEDEFLYDELIEEFENTLSKGSKSKTSTEKTTNITLKPSSGNKPPTIVKGGIIKINALPADLKTIASPGQQVSKNKTNELNSHKRPKPHLTDCPVPTKKPSPWPISISKGVHSSSPSKNKKVSTSNENSLNTPIKQKSVKTPQQKPPKVTDNAVPDVNRTNDPITAETKSISSGPVKRKIGPKLVSKIGQFHSTDDEDLSDEYTEVETLENLDYDVDGTVQEPHRNIINTNESNIRNKSTLSTLENINDREEDPNLDLLRILTDESDNCTQSQAENATNTTVKEVESCSNEKQTAQKGIENEMVNGSSSPNESLVTQQSIEELKERTIYDLINEVSLQRPSWNLHIIPETNAFCIAQVTKGRLGLPTLKKCIELNPEDYNAKVYIHQYHIKRFDGIYDSEDGILALIEEIDSIKA